MGKLKLVGATLLVLWSVQSFGQASAAACIGEMKKAYEACDQFYFNNQDLKNDAEIGPLNIDFEGLQNSDIFLGSNSIVEGMNCGADGYSVHVNFDGLFNPQGKCRILKESGQGAVSYSEYKADTHIRSEEFANWMAFEKVHTYHFFAPMFDFHGAKERGLISVAE